MNWCRCIVLGLAALLMLMTLYMGRIANSHDVIPSIPPVYPPPAQPHFLLFLHSITRLEEWLRRPGHDAFIDTVTWTVVVVTQNGSSMCDYVRRRFSYIHECWVCPRVDATNDRLRRAADVCFQWWLHERSHHRDDVVMLMEADVLVGNVPRFLELLAHEVRILRMTGRSVTTMQSRETMARFCATDHRLRAYCAPHAHYLNGVSLYSPNKLSELGVLRGPILRGFDVDLGTQLLKINPNTIGIATNTTVCMMPLEQLERVLAWILREPECPAWHVFHYLWNAQLYSKMPLAIIEYYNHSVIRAMSE